MPRGVKSGDILLTDEEKRLRKNEVNRRSNAKIRSADPSGWAMRRREIAKKSYTRAKAAHPEKVMEINRERYAADRLRLAAKYAADPVQGRSKAWIKLKYRNADGTQFCAEDYHRMLSAGGGHCWMPGCRKTPEQNKGFLCVDSCHETRKVRGLLCTKHNTAIGQLGDNVAGLKSALEYVQADCT